MLTIRFTRRRSTKAEVDHHGRDDDVQGGEEQKRLADLEGRDLPCLKVGTHVGTVQREQVDVGEDQHRGGPQRCDLQSDVDRAVGVFECRGHWEKAYRAHAMIRNGS
jgi:hypothetical protein